MLYYFFTPENPGVIGEHTVGDVDDSSTVQHLHLVFEGPVSDDIIAANFDVHLISGDLRDKLLASDLTGYHFSELEPELTYDSQWDRLDVTLPDLPKLVWMQVPGIGGQDDFGMLDGRLVVSDKALQLLEIGNISEAQIEDYIPEGEPPYITKYFIADMPTTIERRIEGYFFAYLPADGIDLQRSHDGHYCVSTAVLSRLTERRATGYVLQEPLSLSGEPMPDRPFSMLQINGTRGRHDLVKEPDLPLMLSDRIIDIFDGCSLPNVTIAPLGE